MSAQSKIRRIGNAFVVCAAMLCAGSWSVASDSQSQPQTASPTPAHPKVTHAHARKKKTPPPPPPPLPSGPTGQIQQVPLDSIAAVAPQVSFQNNQLTIVAANSTLADILKAVRKQTGAEIEIPAAPDRVVTHLGPGPARSVIAELLNGSRFNYVLLGAPEDDARLTRVVLVAKGPGDNATATAANAPPANSEAPQPDPNEANDAEAQPDENPPPDEAAEQPAEAEQQAPDQPQVKTPQQMLQEMQQRQMQMQQQQQNGVAPNPNTGMQPHPPQED